MVIHLPLPVPMTPDNMPAAIGGCIEDSRFSIHHFGSGVDVSNR